MEKQKTSENGGSQPHLSKPTQDDMTGTKQTKSMGEPTPDGAASEESVVRSEDNHQYLTGFKLVLVMSTVTMAAFLILLDSAIVATVSQLSCHDL
jgi:hypothetical protein